MISDKTDLQVRYTRQDTLKNQNTLSDLLEKKIKENAPLSDLERENYSEILSKALNSQGNKSMIVITFPNGHIKNFCSLHTFALKLKNMSSNKVVIPFWRERFTFDISVMWEYMYDACLSCFGPALEESIYLSRERDTPQERTSYTFSSDKKID